MARESIKAKATKPSKGQLGVVQKRLQTLATRLGSVDDQSGLVDAHNDLREIEQTLRQLSKNYFEETPDA